jgi:general secretion pathway protein D
MNISSDDVSNILKNSFGEEVRISSIPKMNIVIIVGKKDSTMSAIKLVKELDKEIQQVRITSQILDVTDNLFINLQKSVRIVLKRKRKGIIHILFLNHIPSP